MSFYVRAWHTETGEERWMGPFETAHMASCVAMGWDQGVTLARVYTATEARLAQAEARQAGDAEAIP